MTPETTLTFDAGLLARGWLSAFLATGSDPEVPVLYQTLRLEAFGDGIRLTATDRYMLLSAWIPTVDGIGERGIDEIPDHSLTFCDHDTRAKGFVSYLKKLADRAVKEDRPAPQVNLRLGVAADEGDSPGFPGMELEQVAIEFPDSETVRLGVVEGEYPAWRALLADHKPVKADNFALNPDLLSRVSALGKIHGAYLRFTLGGARKMLLLEPVTDVPPVIRGGLMPVTLKAAEAVA
jgi:hypothetical protein